MSVKTMVTILVKNIEGEVKLPVEGSKLAAGYDIITSKDPVIVGEIGEEIEGNEKLYKRIDYIQYHTTLHISPQDITPPVSRKIKSYHTLLHPRSSIRKYNLVLANSIGLIDNDYRGEILFCFKYIFQPEDFVIRGNGLLGKVNVSRIYKKGDAVGQLVAERTNPMQFQLVSDLEATARGEGGFGSTDVKRESTAEGTISAFKALVGVTPGKSLAELYQKEGGVPVKNRYIDEIKKRDQQVA